VGGGGCARGQTDHPRREALQKNRRGSAPPRVHMNRKMTAHRTGEPTTAQRRGRGATSAQACGPFLSRACPRRRDRGCTPTPPAAAPPQLRPLELHAQTGHRHPLPRFVVKPKSYSENFQCGCKGPRKERPRARHRSDRPQCFRHCRETRQGRRADLRSLVHHPLVFTLVL